MDPLLEQLVEPLLEHQEDQLVDPLLKQLLEPLLEHQEE